MLQIYREKRDAPNLLTIIKKKREQGEQKDPECQERNMKALEKFLKAPNLFPEPSNFFGQITCG